MKNKQLLTGMLATALSVNMVCSNGTVVQAQEVAQEANQINEPVIQTEDEVILNDETGIPDTNLYKAILDNVDNNNDGVLTISELEKVYELDAENRGIKDLTGLEYCKNVYCLYFSGTDSFTQSGNADRSTNC